MGEKDPSRGCHHRFKLHYFDDDDQCGVTSADKGRLMRQVKAMCLASDFNSHRLSTSWLEAWTVPVDSGLAEEAAAILCVF